MKGFEFVSAKDARHAIALMAEFGPKAKILAGGTDLLVDLKSVPEAPPAVIDITRAADMKGIKVTDRGLVIGALATHGEIMSSPEIRDRYPALVDAAHSIGAIQTRSLGTLGGNLVTAVPSLDSGPALVALEALVTIAGPGGSREMPLTEFFVGPRRTALKAGELLVDIVIPKKNLGKPAGFQKFGLRKGQALALVNTAASFWLDPAKKSFVEPCVALGAVAPTVIRAPKAETYLAGNKVTPETMAEAGRIAAGEAKPISDFRASADYRRELIAVLTRRSLEGALAVAERNQKESRK
jgi:CO/xanthine dehydrogenase FAD-binding subunit